MQKGMAVGFIFYLAVNSTPPAGPVVLYLVILELLPPTLIGQNSFA
jgi:hypothetical protein